MNLILTHNKLKTIFFMKRLIGIVVILQIALTTNAQVDSCIYYKHKCDTLNHKLFIAQAQVDWVQYYLATINKHPKDLTYSKGWLIRAVANKLPINPYVKPKNKVK